MAVCEDELICDFAETYHILNYRELSPSLAATLCMGLRDDSRVKMKIAGIKITLEQTLLARITDELAFQSWAKTKDGQKNRNRPVSVLKTILEDKKDEVESFMSPEDFDTTWEMICQATEQSEKPICK